MRTPFVWGTHDCCLWLADWVRARRGVDPAEAVRGTYDDEAGALALIEAAGGLPALLDGYARGVGLAAAEAPSVGDAGAVEVMTRNGPAMVGAICTGPRWAILTPGGLASWPARPLSAWRV